MQKTQNREEEIGVSEISPVNSTPARMRECSVSMCMCVKIEIGLRRCGPVVLGKENDMIPNFSGAGYCNVLSWPL